MNKKTSIYVARHGQTEFNLKGVIGGILEPNPLSPKGEEQAKILSEKLKNIHFDKIYSSALSRAQKTAEIIAKSQGVPVIHDQLLNERNWGSLQGISFDEAQKKHPEAFLKESKIEGTEALKFRYVPDMESLEETIRRYTKFLAKIIQENNGKTVLIVCHFDIMIGYLFSIGYGTYQKLMNASFDHTGYYKLIHDGEKFTVDEIIGLTVKK